MHCVAMYVKREVAKNKKSDGQRRRRPNYRPSRDNRPALSPCDPWNGAQPLFQPRAVDLSLFQLHDLQYDFAMRMTTLADFVSASRLSQRKDCVNNRLYPARIDQPGNFRQIG